MYDTIKCLNWQRVWTFGRFQAAHRVMGAHSMRSEMLSEGFLHLPLDLKNLSLLLYIRVKHFRKKTMIPRKRKFTFHTYAYPISTLR